MTTMIGTQSEYLSALGTLLELEYDALEAYEAAINRLDDANYKNQMEKFSHDHRRHIDDLTQLLIKYDQKPATGPTLKSIMTQGKVMIGNLVNDNAILRAIAPNEEDTNMAYARLCHYTAISEDDLKILEQAHNDAKLHKEWIFQILSDENGE